MKLLLHIGAEKTGTTSVQQWLRINHEALKAHGVWSCRCMGPENNVGLSLLALGRTDQTNLYRMMGIATVREAEAFLRDGRERLRAEVEAAKAAGCDRFFISSEHLHSRLRDRKTVASAVRIIRPLFDTVEIVFFVRPQIDAMISFLSTKGRGGVSILEENFETVTEAYTGLYDYYGGLRNWRDELPDATVEAIAYVRYPSSVSYFLERLGIPENATRMPPRRNSGQDVYALAVGNLLRTPDMGFELRRRINSEIGRLPYVERPRPSRALAEKITAHFEHGNRRLCAEFQGVTPADLTPDWSDYDETGNLWKLSTGRELEAHLRVLMTNILAPGPKSTND